jgi:predicted dehydrogenase
LIADVGPSTLSRVVGWQTVEVERIPDKPTVVAVLEEFVRCLTQKLPMPVTGEDGWRAVVMAEAAYRSAAQGKPVSIR